MYKGWVVGAGGKPEAGYTFQQIFGVAISPRNTGHRPRQAWMA